MCTPENDAQPVAWVAPQEQQQQQQPPLCSIGTNCSESSGSTEAFVEAEFVKRTQRGWFLKDENRDCPSRTKDKEDIAVFRREEVITSGLLGYGSFSEVHRISGFHLSSVDLAEQQDAREHLLGKTSSGHGKYVLKHLRPDLLSRRTKYLQGTADMVIEAMYLAKLDHPNIIKLRGWPSSGASPDTTATFDGFFLILDQIDETLAQRIARWQLEESRVSSCQLLCGSHHLSAYRTKLKYAVQIASALDYLHDRDIIFRDLKPDNVGFKGETIQLFDFGLVRQLPEERPQEDKLFHMTGIGTRRYMAPEVLKGEHYNLKADVYSWTIVFHSMLSLQKPFEGCDLASHYALLARDKARPTLPAEWPKEIQQLCIQGWAERHQDRPTMKQVWRKLNAMVQSAKNPCQQDDRNASQTIVDFLMALNDVIKANQEHMNSLSRMLEWNGVFKWNVILEWNGMLEWNECNDMLDWSIVEDKGCFPMRPETWATG